MLASACLGLSRLSFIPIVGPVQLSLAVAQCLKPTLCAGGLSLSGTHCPYRHPRRATLKKRSLHKTGLLPLQLAA